MVKLQLIPGYKFDITIYRTALKIELAIKIDVIWNFRPLFYKIKCNVCTKDNTYK